MNDTTPPTVPNNPAGEAPKLINPEASNGDALVQPELPEFKGGVNAVAPAINEIPAFDLSKLENSHSKVEDKNKKSLPNTGVNSSSTTALGLSLIALVGLAVRRKLSK